MSLSNQILQLKHISSKAKNQFIDFSCKLGRGLEDLIFPQSCVICSCSLDYDYNSPLYCQECLDQIWLPKESACVRCSARLPYKIEGKRKVAIADFQRSADGCQSCRDREWPFGRVISVGVYEGELRRHVYGLKQPMKLAESYQAGLLLGHKIRHHLSPDELRKLELLVPIPIHWRRWFSRKFNQAELIAQGVSKITGIPVEKSALKQAAWKKKQGTLSARKRIQNVKSSIKVGPGGERVRGKHVLLIDDVMTTGATLTAAASVLKTKLKPASIDVAIVARASLV